MTLIHQAAAQIRRTNLPPTPMVYSPMLRERLGRPVVLKCENQQITGSFKVRGALARLSLLEGEARYRGVVAASAGNHGLGVAWACRALGVPGLVVLPETAPRVKLDLLRQMLVKIRLHGAGYDDAEVYAREVAKEAEATFVSPFDDPHVMAGNGGTVGLEIREQLPDCGAVVSPVGGGGLACGLAVALSPIPVLGVNSAASPAMARSLAEGRVYHRWPPSPTLAEGLEGGVSDTSAALCARHLHGVEVVSEEGIAAAMRFMAHHHRIVLEGSAAVGVAALLEGKPVPGSGPVCIVLTGRNIDLQRFRQLLEG